MFLNEARCGEKIKVKKLWGEEAILKKVEGMGLRKDMIFEVIQRCGRNILLKNGENRIVVSIDIAKKIEVESIERREPPCEVFSCGRKRHRHGWKWCFLGKEEE